jgi:hypothetical protein
MTNLAISVQSHLFSVEDAFPNNISSIMNATINEILTRTLENIHLQKPPPSHSTGY